jgi:single-strand DNA-binding protein
MLGINKVVLIGHIGEDPSLRTLRNEITVLSFPLATSEITQVKELRQEQTEWHNIIMWRSLANSAAKLLVKGQLVYIEGRLRTHAFEKNGVRKITTEILADAFTLLGARKASA